MNNDRAPSISVELCESVSEAAALEAAQAILEIVPDADALTLIITDDLDPVARDLLGDAAGERDVKRAWAQTSGITIGNHIVLSSHVFGQGHYHRYVASHEALHVALAQREESTHNLRRRGFDGEFSMENYVAIAGIACEEYRVELAMADRFAGGHDGLADDFARATVDFAHRTQEASDEYQQTLDVETLAEMVIPMFQEITNMAAYLATTRSDDELATITAPVPPDVAALVLGKGWEAATALLRELPSADSPTARSELDASAVAYADALRAWHAQIGFRVTNQRDGAYQFDVLNPEVWDQLDLA